MVRSVALVCLWQLNGTFALFVQGGQCRSRVNRWVRGLCSPFPSLQKLSLWDIAPSQLFMASPHDRHSALKLTSNTNYFKEDVMWAAGCCTVGCDFLKMQGSVPLILFSIPSQRSVLGAARPVSFANVIRSAASLTLQQAYGVLPTALGFCCVNSLLTCFTCADKCQ